jgi:hypothetical protein
MRTEIERLIATAAAMAYQVETGTGGHRGNGTELGAGGRVQCLRRHDQEHGMGDAPVHPWKIIPDSGGGDGATDGEVTLQEVARDADALGIRFLLLGAPRVSEADGRMVVRVAAAGLYGWAEAVGVSGPDDPMLAAAGLPRGRSGWLIAAALHATSAALSAFERQAEM